MKCKQGDLCYIKKALRNSNIGKVVTTKLLIGKLNRGDHYKWNGETFIAYDSDYHWVISSKSGIETQFGNSLEAVIMDSWLVPINGDNIVIEDDVKELEEV